MISYPPALRSTGFVAPRAIGRFGEAILEARASQAASTPRPAPARQRGAVRPYHPAGAPPQRRTVVRLWLPSTLLFLLLAPFALLLAPFLYWIPSPYCARPFATVWSVGAVLLSLSGTVVDVDTPDALVRIRLF